MTTELDVNRDVDDILIVDDEDANLKLLSEILAREGYRVRPSNSPLLAIDSATSQPPKLILMDVKMSEMDGFEGCRKLKQAKLTRHIPIIFISSLRETKERVAGFAAGGVDFISKPFDEQEVLARVRTHVNLRNLQLNMDEQVRKRTEEVFESEARFRATFDQAAVGIAHVAPDGHFLRLNDRYCEIVNYSKSEMLGLTFQDITSPDDLDADVEQLNRLLNGEIKTYTMEKRYVRKDGDLVWVDLTVSLVFDEAGQPEWFVAVVQDITDRKLTEKALKESEDQLIKAQEMANVGSWQWDISENRIEWSPQVYKIYGIDPEISLTYETLLKSIHPEDREHHDKITAAWLNNRGGPPYEYRVVRPNGDIRYIYGKGEVECDAVGKPVRFSGTLQDVTEQKNVEMALQKSEQLARSLLNATTDLTSLLDEDGTILDLNNAMARILDGKREELIGCNIFDLLPPEMTKDRKPRVMQALAEGKSIRYIDRNRPNLVSDTGIYPIVTAEGEKNQVVIFAHDITEHEKTEDELRKSEARFRSYFHLPFHGVAITSPSKGWIEVNDRICSMLGYDRDELLSMTWAELTHPEDILAGDEKFESALAGQIDSYSLEKRFIRKDGMVIWTHLDVACVRTPDGEIDYFVAVLVDITERKESEQQLQVSRDYLNHLINSIPDAIFSVKLPERIVEWARDSYGILGHDLDKYIGNTTEWLYPSLEEYQAFGELIQSVIRQGKDSLITQMEMLNNNGEAVPVEVNATIFRDKGKPVSMIGLIRDITGRKKMEETLRANEQTLRKAQEIAHLGSWSWDLATDQLTWSEEMYKIYGIEPGTPLTFEALLDRVLPEDREHHKQLAAELVEGTTGPNFRYRIIRPSGSVRYIYGTGLVERDEHGSPTGISGTLQDVTDIKTMEMAFRGSETRLKEVQRIALIGFWELDALTKKLSWSDEIFQMLELNQQEFKASFETFLSIIHPDDQEMVKKQYNDSFEKHQPYSGTCRIVLPGGKIKHLYRSARPIVDLDGRLLRTVGIIQDITELKDAQNESMHLRLELAHLNRIMTMNELAASLAHEINQPLGAIMNNASTAKLLNSQEAGEKENFDEILNDIAQDALRAGQIINKIRGVMQKGEASYTSLDVNALLDDVIALYQNSFSIEHISVDHEKDPQLPPVKGDRVRLQQVLMNLITNAMDAMENSPQKELSFQTACSGNAITVSIRDTGSGIASSKIDQIFDPFYTTKNEGMGIGLRLCKSIVEEHGGRIWAENNADSGMTFHFTLKAATEGYEHEFA